jgi:hypothetical protein
VLKQWAHAARRRKALRSIPKGRETRPAGRATLEGWRNGGRVETNWLAMAEESECLEELSSSSEREQASSELRGCQASASMRRQPIVTSEA